MTVKNTTWSKPQLIPGGTEMAPPTCSCSCESGGGAGCGEG
jgi:hypothetical protein